ncbi:MAG: T9SS type A sorting domain-containing protein [Bacteroidales bacterium]|nr:T9SS type A sorting domain-containing protein [Bacteroidales bacterium]
MDIDNNPIDPDCLSADFIAGSSLGWEVFSHYRWKDWTCVGFDVTPFHGQTIRVRLTTYDCGEYRCFTYAYFRLTCGHKCITASGCGYTEYEYSAPSGFHYDWFWRDDPSHSISHDQTVHVSPDSSRELGCHVTFVENSSCGFELFTSTKRRFPLSGCTIAETECLNKFHCINESLVSNDGIHPDGTGNPCDDVFWDFGDGQTSYDFSPTHAYSFSGDFTVTMIAGLNDFECTDTSFLEVHIPENALIDTVTCEPFIWAGEAYLESGEYHRSFTTASGCDSLVTLRLDANYPPEFHLHGDHWPIGGTELAWTQYTYSLVLDNPLCSVDSIKWSVDCPTMSVLPADDGLSCELRIFSFLPANDSVPLRAVAHNRCGTEERTLWIHTSYYGIDDHALAPAVLEVFPNPASGVLNIRMRGLVGETRMELYDGRGTLVDKWARHNKSDDETVAYDTSRLPEGLYLLRVSCGRRSVATKILVRR